MGLIMVQYDLILLMSFLSLSCFFSSSHVFLCLLFSLPSVEQEIFQFPSDLSFIGDLSLIGFQCGHSLIGWFKQVRASLTLQGHPVFVSIQFSFPTDNQLSEFIFSFPHMSLSFPFHTRVNRDGSALTQPMTVRSPFLVLFYFAFLSYPLFLSFLWNFNY